jgi:TctA family transporter
MSEGSPWIFFQRTISAVFLLTAIVFLISPLFTRGRIGEKAIEMQQD